jgi:hypothetical protein
LSVEADHETLICVELSAVAETPPGTDGGVVSASVVADAGDDCGEWADVESNASTV